MSIILNKAIRLAKLSLAFGRVERITRHEDGIRPETDTDHTFMLGLIALEMAPSWLNRGELARYALIHDLVEVYANDEQTLTITAELRTAKEKREAAALARLTEEFGEDSHMIRSIVTYEEANGVKKPRYVCHEARYIRLLDKVLPKLTHLFNGCVTAKKLVDYDGFVAAHEAQYAKLTAEYGTEFPETLTLLREAMDASQVAWAEGGPVDED